MYVFSWVFLFKNRAKVWICQPGMKPKQEHGGQTSPWVSPSGLRESTSRVLRCTRWHHFLGSQGAFGGRVCVDL